MRIAAGAMLGKARFHVGTARHRLWGWKPYPAPVWPVCPLCGSDEREVVGRRVAFEMRYRNVLCPGCGLVYLCPRPTADSFSDFYERLYPSLYGKTRQDDVGTIRGDGVLAFLSEALELDDHRGLFDVGCGGGGLLRSVARRVGPSLRLAGCDPGWPGDGDTVVREGDAEIAIYKRDVAELGHTLPSYSIFVLYDVIEHLLSPRTFLELLHRQTEPGSMLFISTNALDYWEAIPSGGWERYYLRLAHTYTFTKETLAALLRGTGWEPEEERAAPKGDQWVLARRTMPRPALLAPLPGEAEKVRSFIAGYRARAAR